MSEEHDTPEARIAAMIDHAQQQVAQTAAAQQGAEAAAALAQGMHGLGINPSDPYPLQRSKADLYDHVTPLPAELAELPEIAAAAEEYRAAMGEWRDIRDALSNQRGKLAAADEADRAFIRKHVEAGTRPKGSLTPSRDDAVWALTSAHSSHVAIHDRAMLATVRLHKAVRVHKESGLAWIEAERNRIDALLAPYREVIVAGAKHLQRLDALADWVEATSHEWKLPYGVDNDSEEAKVIRVNTEYRGRPLASLPTLPDADHFQGNEQKMRSPK